MAELSSAPPFIAIEGNIGAGKTSLSKMLAEALDRRLLLEQFDDNPFLPYFYEDPERHALPVELFFLTSRFKQWEQELAQNELFHQGLVADYTFIKTLLFARKNLNEAEFRLFHRIYEMFRGAFPEPDLVVYLHRPIPWLLEQIARRGRSAEAAISGDYLQTIQEAYLSYFRHEADRPTLILELGETDFVGDPKEFQAIRSLLEPAYEPGVHIRTFT